MTWRVHVRILPRAGLLDPQGQAVEHALSALHFPEASNVHVGKAIALDVAAASASEAKETSLSTVASEIGVVFPFRKVPDYRWLRDFCRPNSKPNSKV